MENKLVIAIAALMVVALAAPVVMAADVSYTASVVASDVIVTQVGTGAFGDLLAGDTKEISPSLTLSNSGGAAANVDAKFTSNDGTTYGLVSETDVMGGSNFQIGTNGNETALLDTFTDVSLGADNQVLAGGSASYDAILDVPAGQAVGSYAGTVQLTFIAV